MEHRVVITGLGAVTPIGNDVATLWANAKAGVCGIGPITAYDTEGRKATLAAQVDINIEDYISKNEARKMDRFTQFAVIAADQAVADSGLDLEKEDLSRCGVIMSSGIGGLSTIEHEHSRGLEKGFDRVSPFFIPMAITNIAPGYVAIRTGFKGYCGCSVTACAGSTYALGDAMRQVRHGYQDVMLCGGSEACITPLGIGGFTSMKALNETDDPARASIPFDKERSGFVMGEGAGCLVLESLEHAKARGAHIYGELAGFGATCDAHHITAPAPGGEGGARSMQLAIEDAHITPDQVGYINAHGTSTPMNDKCETAAIHTVFGADRKDLAVSSTKSMTGHMLGAAGAVEAILTTLTVKEGYLPPTIGYQIPDPECDLDVVPNVGRKADVKFAISNSLGFGGHNASVLIARYDG